MENIYDKESSVIELTKKDFDKKYKIKNKEFKYKNGLLIFYAPWCVHCINSGPMIEEIADLFKHKFTISALNTYNVNEKNDKIAKHFGIFCYPTIRYVENGIVTDQVVSSKKEELIDFVIVHSQKSA